MEHSNREKTPKKILVNGLGTRKTPISTPKNFASRFLLLSNNQNCTPSPNSLKTRVVRNPFENQQHEKLRLPVISSPSLFQPPTTPKQENKLELFEWTIEELSNLNPVNVVPHETQFREEEDPQFEEKAQAAISSFFQEQQIVPSPHVCNLRKHKIQLKDENIHSTQIYNSTALPSNSAMISNNTSTSFGCLPKIKRDIMTQTALSFPPNLPREIEDLLKKYQMNNEDENEENELPSNDRSMMDISTLRRKLFIQRPETPENDFVSDDAFAVNLSPAPRTPELTRSSFMSSQNNGDAFEVINGDMFGELSPIRNNYSNNCSPAMSSHDISMNSDVGCTPASRRCSKLKKKKLSESFSLLQNDSDDDKENFHSEFPAVPKDRRIFGRVDSGFENSDSNNTMNCSFSAEFMQI